MAFSNVRPCYNLAPIEVQVCYRFGAQRHSWSPQVPGDFMSRDARERATVLDECLAEWADDEGYAVERCSWELLTELPEGLEENEGAGWGEEYTGNGKYRYRGR